MHVITDWMQCSTIFVLRIVGLLLCKWFLLIIYRHIHCSKSVQIRSLFWSVFSPIRTEYGKIRTRKNSVVGDLSHSEYLSWSSQWNYMLNGFGFSFIENLEFSWYFKPQRKPGKLGECQCLSVYFYLVFFY